MHWSVTLFLLFFIIINHPKVSEWALKKIHKK